MMPTQQSSTERKQHIEQTCLRLLAMREHSQRELIDKLALKGYKANEVLPIIIDMAEKGWQDNQRFAECYARQRMQKGYGPLKIQYELQQRGIEALELNHWAEENLGGWFNGLIGIYQHKYDDQTQLTQAEWFKRSRFLQQRGYSGAMIKQLLTELNIKLV